MVIIFSIIGAFTAGLVLGKLFTSLINKIIIKRSHK